MRTNQKEEEMKKNKLDMKNGLAGKAIEKNCPECENNVKLMIRKNTQNDSLFIGCPRYPMCTYTEKLPEHLRMEINGQPKLFQI